MKKKIIHNTAIDCARERDDTDIVDLLSKMQMKENQNK